MNEYMNNKGVTTVLDSDTSESSRVEYPKKSISAVKRDLETVINLMGPETPHFNQTSSDLDNEETYSVVSKIEKSDVDDSLKTTCTETLPRDDRNSVFVERDSSCTNCSVISVNHYRELKYPDGCKCNYPGFNGICPKPMRPLQVVNRKLSGKPSAKSRYVKPKNAGAFSWVKNVLRKAQTEKEESLGSDYYKINVRRSTMQRIPPKKLVFELVDKTKQKKFNNPVIVQCSNPDCLSNSAQKIKDLKNISNEKMVHYLNTDTLKLIEDTNLVNHNNDDLRKATVFDFDASTRVDLYYFDHGDVKYLQTVDRSPLATTEMLAERTEEYTTKFWAEVFGTIHIGFSFCTSFILQLCRFLTVSLVRPMSVGVIQVFSDYFFKPFLATLFNAILQPPLLFLYNVTTSIRDLCHPLAESFGYFLREIAEIFRAFRLIEVKNNQPIST